jgi:sugar lactone lactonase YvrE
VPGLPVFVSGLDFGEGPRWHDGRLWFSDFHQHTVSSVGDDGVRLTELELDDYPSGLGWLPDGRLLVVAMQSRQVLRVEADGSVVAHADLSGIARGRCNDMVVAADGTAYVGNFGFELGGGDPMRPAALARVTPGGEVSVAADGLEFPNGSVITPDGRTLIVGETFGKRATAFTVAADGTLHDRRVWADLGEVLPDGCTLDAEGAIWFADARGTAVVRVREGGEVTDRVETGQTTFACALGGDDGRTLFIVCADSARDEDVVGTATGTIRTLRVDVPHSGRP